MRKIVTALMVLCIATHPTIVLAEDTEAPVVPDLRITGLTKGDAAPFTGVLLTPDALSKIESDAKLEISLLKTQHEFGIQKLQLKLDAEQALRLSEKKLHDDLFQSQLRRIESLEEIAINKRPDWVLPVAILTSFVVGSAVTVGITYAVNQ